MIAHHAALQVWLCAGYTDMRKSFQGLSMIVQQQKGKSPYDANNLYLFRGRRGDRIKMLWFDGTGMCLYLKRLESGLFVWPMANEGVVHLSQGQLQILLEGIDWRHPKRAYQPALAG